jgi:PAS domain S-box-containing protein
MDPTPDAYPSIREYAEALLRRRLEELAATPPCEVERLAQSLRDAKYGRRAVPVGLDCRHLLNSMRDAILIFDPDSELILDVNPQACALYGYPREELIGHSLDLIQPVERRGWEKTREILACEGPRGVELVHFRKDHSRLFVEVTATEVCYEGGRAVLSVNRDVTERKAAEEAIRIAKERFDRAVRAGSVGVWDWDLRTDDIHIDPNLKAMLGYADHEIPNHMSAWVQHVYPADRDAVGEAVAAHLEGRTREFEIEHRMLKRDGGICWFLARGEAVRNSEGRPYRMVGTDTNITEHKQAKEAEAAAIEKYRLVASSIPGFVYQIVHAADGALTVPFVSEGVAAIMGWSAEELAGGAVDAWELLHPDDADRLRRVLGDSAGRLKPLTIELRVRTRSGESKWVRFSSTPQLRANGDILLNGVALDVTSRKRAEIRMQESEARFRQLAANIRAVFWIYSISQGKLIYVSPGFEHIWGWPCEQLYENSSTWANSILEEDRERVAKKLGGASTQFDEEYRIRRSDGTIRWIRDRGFGVRDDHGETYRIAGIAEDVTELKEAARARQLAQDELEWRVAVRTEALTEVNASLRREIAERTRIEAALRASEQRFAGVVAMAHDAIISIDAEQRIIMFNRGAERIFGYTSEEIFGESLDTLIPADYRESHRRRVDDAAADAGPRLMNESREVRGRRKNGEEFPAEVTISTLTHDGKQIKTAVLRDISARKRAEARSREHLAELAHVARLSTMGEMATGLAHELNQPLTAIVNYAEACLRMMRSGAAGPAELCGELENVVVQAQRAGSIIQRLRSFVRKRKPKSTIVRANHLIKKVVDLVASDAHSSGVTIQLDLCKAMPPIRCDAIQIEQVILNLLRNALDALGPVRGRERQIVIRSAAAGEMEEISVADNGPGLATTDPKQVFDPFFTTKSDGMGMGLSISQSIVEAHHGQLIAESSPGRGATFTIRLPALDTLVGAPESDVSDQD